MPGTDGSLTVFTWEGDELPGWPRHLDTRNNSSPSVGELDGAPGLEILVGSYDEGKVFALDADGSHVPGWPIQTGADVWSTPTLADLDQDGDIEVVLSGMDVTVYVWDTRGDYDDGAGVEWSPVITRTSGRSSSSAGSAASAASMEATLAAKSPSSPAMSGFLWWRKK